MLSVIIPSRNLSSWKFTQKTVDDLFEKACGEIEVIVVLDGYTLSPPLVPRKNLIIIHNETAKGMRPAINQGVDIAHGKYIMKCDDHCMFAQGYDIALANDCDDNWLAVPNRYSLDGENWTRKYGPISYLYLTYPYNLDNQFGFGLHGKKWHGEHGFNGDYYCLEKRNKHIMIDDIIAFQGSCWFMSKELYQRIGRMQYIGFLDHQEAQELAFKVLLLGGRCVVNKKTWYAHLHKGPTYGRGYQMFKHRKVLSEIFSTELWMKNQWENQILSFKQVIENPKWWPLEYWPEDWDNIDRIKNYNYLIWSRSREIQLKAKQDFIYVDNVNKYV